MIDTSLRFYYTIVVTDFQAHPVMMRYVPTKTMAQIYLSEAKRRYKANMFVVEVHRIEWDPWLTSMHGTFEQCIREGNAALKRDGRLIEL
jgi:hypothetical protein